VLREKIKEVSSRRESFLLALQWCRAHACAWRSGKQQGSEEREGINGRLRDKGPKGSSTLASSTRYPLAGPTRRE